MLQRALKGFPTPWQETEDHQEEVIRQEQGLLPFSAVADKSYGP